MRRGLKDFLIEDCHVPERRSGSYLKWIAEFSAFCRGKGWPARQNTPSPSTWLSEEIGFPAAIPRIRLPSLVLKFPELGLSSSGS